MKLHLYGYYNPIISAKSLSPIGIRDSGIAKSSIRQSRIPRLGNPAKAGWITGAAKIFYV